MAAINPAWCTEVVDLSHHHQQTVDWAAAKAAGLVAVIHKATEGRDVPDVWYHKRKAEVTAAGLKWGSYHFAGPVAGTGVAQADYYLNYADPQPDEFICFDCEKHGTLANMQDFVGRVRAQLGRYPAIYGGDYLRSLMSGAGAGSIATRGVLWLCEYPDAAVPKAPLPAGWANWSLWQYTDGASGPDPTDTAQVGAVDRNAFIGDAAALLAAWPFTRA